MPHVLESRLTRTQPVHHILHHVLLILTNTLNQRRWNRSTLNVYIHKSVKVAESQKCAILNCNHESQVGWTRLNGQAYHTSRFNKHTIRADRSRIKPVIERIVDSRINHVKLARQVGGLHACELLPIRMGWRGMGVHAYACAVNDLRGGRGGGRQVDHVLPNPDKVDGAISDVTITYITESFIKVVPCHWNWNS